MSLRHRLAQGLRGPRAGPGILRREETYPLIRRCKLLRDMVSLPLESAAGDQSVTPAGQRPKAWTA